MSTAEPTPVPILLYHSVSDHPTGDFGPYTVSRAQFASHLDRLQDLGFTTLTVGDLVRRRATGTPLPVRTAVITVDDGFADFAENAWPELSRRRLAATLYVTAGTLGGRSAWLAPLAAESMIMLDAGQLRELDAEGCEIGAHSMTHPQLDCLPAARAADEIRQSKDVLEQLLGRTVDSFAYPHGYHDRAVKQLVTGAGYTSATAVRNALSPVGDDRFALARVTVTAEFDADRVGAVLQGRGAPVARPREQLRTRAWREVRRHRQRRSDRSAAKLATR